MAVKLKKKKKEKYLGIGKRITLSLAVLLIIVFTAMTIYVSRATYNHVVDLNQKAMTEETRKMARTLEGHLSMLYVTGNDITATVENMLNYPEDQKNRNDIKDAMKKFLERNNMLSGIGVFFEKNAFDNKDSKFVTGNNPQGRVAFYASKAGNGKIDVSVSNAADKLDEMQWYKKTFETKKPTVLNPYMEDNKIFTTIAFPIVKNGNVIGTVNADMDSTFIQEKLEAITGKSKENLIALFTGDGTVVADSLDINNSMKNIIQSNPEYKEYIDKAVHDEETQTTMISSVSKLKSKAVFVPVSIEGIDERWVFESCDSINSFLAGAKKQISLIIFMNILSVVVIIGISYYSIAKNITKPVGIIQRAIDKIANYHLDIEEEKKESSQYLNEKNEIGDMARAIVKMTDNLTHLISSISKDAQDVAATSEELTATTQNTAHSANEVSSAVNNIAQGATNQAQDTQAAAEDVEATSQLLQSIMGVLDNLLNSTNYIDTKKDEGYEVLDKLTKATINLKAVTQKVSEIIMKNNQSTEQITTSSDMIQSISDQTNLLALNAAIEAARAGEAGRGFAVVAEEIRKLAEQSAGFTEEIRKVINELKTNSMEAVESITEGSEMVEIQEATVQETKDKFNEIATALEESKNIVTNINQSSRDLETKNQSIVGVVENLSAIAEENAATTEEASASVHEQTESLGNMSKASENLAQIAQGLQNEISKFQI